ncbi:MAG TPA: cytochrome c biogenesis protein CcsA [Acidimicrobiales bacterium]|nr:cytochrome c biogenesis protein CcsA [Acidimicrobiales bacterium]
MSERQATTASRGTRVLGAASLAGMAVVLLFAFVLSPEDSDQGDLVRILYVHVPTAWLAYVAFIVTAVGGAMYLKKRSVWWDLVAAASAEIGVLFCALALFTGSVWGRHTWGTYWEWTDVRIVTTLVLLLMYVGYLALRRIPGDPHVRSQRAAVVGIIAALNIPIVRFSVDWWANRTIHQKATVNVGDTNLDGLMLFTLMLSLVVFTVVYAWMLVHRFRIAWLEDQLERRGLDVALAERRAEAERGVERAVGGFMAPPGVGS